MPKQESTRERWQCFQLGWEVFHHVAGSGEPVLFDPLVGSIKARLRLLGMELDFLQVEAFKGLPLGEKVQVLPSLKAFLVSQIVAVLSPHSANAFCLGFDLALSMVVHINIVMAVAGESDYVESVQKAIAEELDKIDIDPELVRPVLDTLGDANISGDAFTTEIVKLSGQLAQILENPRSREKIFVVMPFSDSSLGTYSTIKTAARLTGYFAWRSDDKPLSGAIIDTVFRKGIEDAAMVIIDLTEGRPNVHIELGLAMANDKPKLLIAASGTVSPFDVGHLETIFFNGQEDLLRQLKDQLRRHALGDAAGDTK
jgi:hypothetical protein